MIRKWRESKVAIEGGCLFIRRVDDDGENRETQAAFPVRLGAIRFTRMDDARLLICARS